MRRSKELPPRCPKPTHELLQLLTRPWTMPPLIAGTLQTTYGNWAVALMLATIGAVGLVCAYLLPETNGIALLSARSHDDASVVS